MAHDALPAPYATALRVLGVLYGVPVWGFAVLWTAIAAAITLRTARRHLPFSLTWWSFTFPVGTCVTATTTLAVQTGSAVLRVAAAVWYAALVAGLAHRRRPHRRTAAPGHAAAAPAGHNATNRRIARGGVSGPARPMPRWPQRPDDRGTDGG